MTPAKWATPELASLASNDEPICYGVLKPGEYRYDGVILIRIVDLERNLVNESDLFRISKALDREFKRSRLKGGELLFSIQGTIGRVAIAPDWCAEANISRTIARVCIDVERANPRYVRQWFLSEYGLRAQRDAVSGTTRDSLNLSALRRIEVPCPESVLEQSKIAEVLSTVDSAIAQTEALIAKQQRIKTGLMQDLLTRGIDEHGQLRSEATHTYKDSLLGRIPEEWEVTTVDEIATITTGDKDTQDADAGAAYPFFVRSQTIERISSYSFDGEAVLTAGDGVGTGKVFHYIDGRFDYHQRVYCMHSFTNDVLGYYFFCYFREHFMERVAQFSAKGSVDSVRRHMIAKMLMPRPSADEQTEVVRILREAARCIADYGETLEKLRSLKTALMQDLLTGKVCVTPLLQPAAEAATA